MEKIPFNKPHITDKDGVKIPLKRIGHLSAFYFYGTRNIQCGEVNKYGWVDTGSSSLPALFWAQPEELDKIQTRRKVIRESYYDGREILEADRYSECPVRLPMFYSLNQTKTINLLKYILP